MDKLRKVDLVDAIFEKTSCERQVISQIIDHVFQEIKAGLEAGNRIELRGFGTFEPRLRKGRASARNPKTGKTVSVEPHYVAAFRSGKELKENLWKLNKKK